MRFPFPSFLLSLILLASGAAASSGTAQAGHKHGHERGDFHGKFKELNLTPEQQKKIKDLRQAGHESAKKLREEMKESREKMKEAVKKDAGNEELTKLFQTVQQRQQALGTQRFTQALAIREVLTPDQRKKAGEIMGGFFGPGKKGHADLEVGDED